VTLPSERSAEIARRFTTAEETVSLPGFTVTLCKPRNSDDLISEADYVKDERLPYWADLWASARTLASYIVEERVSVHAAIARDEHAADALHPSGPRDAPWNGASFPRALELGCGLGLVAIALQHVGFATLATDYYEDALLFAAHNAERASGTAVETRLVDWTAMPTDLGHFDLVVAADVLYEMRYAPVLAAAVSQTLAPHGVFLLADQGRIALDAFLQETTSRGLVSRILRRVAPPEGVAQPSITIYELRWGR
jgi:predicted nicotinamide N-methyase